MFRNLLRKLIGRPKPTECIHEWTVFGTASADVVLELQCQKCLMLGVVADPTEEEWGDAYYASESPYTWDDNARVATSDDAVQVALALQLMERGKA